MKKKHTAKNTELDAHENTALASADRGEKHKCLLDQKKSNPGGRTRTNERTSERASEEEDEGEDDSNSGDGRQ
jgi:hypothetical protein